MKLHIFGTQALRGIQPGRSSIAWALEKDGILHWFEAGENCSRTAFFMGLENNRICRIFLSGLQLDFCSGLTGLLGRMKEPCQIYTPVENALDGFEKFFRKLGTGTAALKEHFMGSSGSAEQDGVNVSWRSAEKGYIFRIESEKKKIVYAPSVVSADELGDWLRDPDLLIWGTVNVGAVEICRKLKHEKRHVGKLVLICHDGAETEDDIRSRVADIGASDVYFAEDAQTFEL
ncbi:MAG: hypothetical protein IKA87_04750 [Lentisphaeria bacterium]|nr:hypothetical protein [Lentisphaeria bacterium]